MFAVHRIRRGTLWAAISGLLLIRYFSVRVGSDSGCAQRDGGRCRILCLLDGDRS